MATNFPIKCDRCDEFLYLRWEVSRNQSCECPCCPDRWAIAWINKTGGILMAVKVYSAAIGTMVMRNSTIGSAWHECTEMFRNHHASSFMRGHWPIDYLNDFGNGPREEDGSIYRCTTGTDGIRFVKIVSSEPPRSFAYISAYLSDPRRERNIYLLRQEIEVCPRQNRMEFRFEGKGADAVVTIKRREKGDVSWWEDLTDKHGDLAAINLSFILTGRNEIAPNVQRADALRVRF